MTKNITSLPTVIALVITGTVSGACALAPRQAEVRYRVTIVVDDAGVERRGSAVWSTMLSRPALPLASTYNARFRGDAIPIKLRNGGTFLILPKSWFPKDPDRSSGAGIDAGIIPRQLFRDTIAYHGDDDIQRYLAIQQTSPSGRLVCPDIGFSDFIDWRAQPSSGPPTSAWCFSMAYARDYRSPASLQPFDPRCAYFDKGCFVRVKRVTVDVTNAPVTRPLTATLPWLRGEYDFSGIIDGSRAHRLGVSPVIFDLRG